MKKNIALVVILVLMLAMFTGCAPKQAAPATTPEVTTEAPATEAPATEEATEATAEEATADVVTTASIVDNADAMINALSANGTWIIATLNDITTDQELVAEGEFINKEKVARKLAPYTQDADHNITASFTITAPKLTVKSENFKLQGGTFVGDIFVEANGFQLSKAAVTGNVYFASEEYKASAVISDDSTVSGTMEVK